MAKTPNTYDVQNRLLTKTGADGSVVAHMIYDPWGAPLLETYTDANYSGLDNLNNFTGYAWDETLGLYFAQNRFYDAVTHRFTQEDAVKDGGNWYAYCGNDPLNYTDPNGYFWEELQSTLEGHGWKTVEELAEDGERWANWRNILYDNSVVRIDQLPKYQTESARNAAVDNIYYEEAEKLQKEFKTLYYGSASFTLLHKTLQPLYTDFKRPKESHDLREVALQGFLSGFDTGLKTAPFLDGYFSKDHCPDAEKAASGVDSTPQKVKDIAAQVKSNNGSAPQGYKGGRTYKNIPVSAGGQKLPEGVNYKEYDVNPYIKGQNRGTERIVIGDDGSVWYTNDHYHTFIRVIEGD